MNLKLSNNGLDLLIEDEGMVLYSYDDHNPAFGMITDLSQMSEGGTLTIGVGHTGPDVVPGMTINEAQARALLAGDVQWAEQRVNTSVDVPLSQPQFDALVSHTFNTGGSETLFDLINAKAPADEIKNWWLTTYITSGGVPLPGLKKRRRREWELFSTGIYPGQKKN